MINFFKNMITDASGGINSKIFVGLISFFVSLAGYFLGVVQFDKFCAMLAFSSSALGWSYLDNKSAIQIKYNDTKISTETTTTNKNTDTKIDVDVSKVVKSIKEKKKA